MGTYPITVSGGTDNNYSLTYNAGTLTVNKSTLTATAENKSRTYGETNPVLTIAYAGFKNSETASVIDTPPTITTTATVLSNVGTYPITVTGGTDNNYLLTYSNGTLTITQAAQTITFLALTDLSQSAGSFTVSATSSAGLPVTFSSTDAGKVSVNGTTVTITGPGSATITASQTGDINYSAAAPVSRTLCIFPLAPTVAITDSPSLALNSSATTGNQWYLNGQAISGATGKTFVVTSSGVYAAKVIVDGCVGPLSASVNLIITGDETGWANGGDGADIQLYPNPVKDEVRYILSDRLSRATEVTVINGMGQVVMSVPAKRSGSIDMGSLPNGAYTLQVNGSRTGMAVRRFLKQ